MLIINNHIIHAFDPSNALARCLKSYEYANYNYLFRAVRYCRFGGYSEKLKIGDKFKTSTEFYKFEESILIFLEEDGKQFYQMIMHGEVYADVTEPNCSMIEAFFEQKHFTVLDNYGKELNIKSQSELVDFVNMTNAINDHFEQNKALYHNYMRKLTSWREYRDSMPNESLGDTFEKLISLGDRFGQEMRDILTDCLGNRETELSEKYYSKPDSKEKMFYIFGLYISVLKAFVLSRSNDDIMPQSLEENIYYGFLKEFNYYLQRHRNILAQYSKFMDLRPFEVRSISELLKEEGLDGSKWSFDSSDIIL